MDGPQPNHCAHAAVSEKHLHEQFYRFFRFPNFFLMFSIFPLKKCVPLFLPFPHCPPFCNVFPFVFLFPIFPVFPSCSLFVSFIVFTSFLTPFMFFHFSQIIPTFFFLLLLFSRVSPYHDVVNIKTTSPHRRNESCEASVGAVDPLGQNSKLVGRRPAQKKKREEIPSNVRFRTMVVRSRAGTQRRVITTSDSTAIRDVLIEKHRPRTSHRECCRETTNQ